MAANNRAKIRQFHHGSVAVLLSVLLSAINGPNTATSSPMRAISSSTFILGPTSIENGITDNRQHHLSGPPRHQQQLQPPRGMSLRSLPGGPPTWAPPDKSKDFSAALYVSKFAKMYDQIRRSGRSAREAVVTARESLASRGMGPWIWVNGATRRVDSPAEYAKMASVPVNSVFVENAVAKSQQPVGGLQSISYSVQSTGVPSYDAFQAYSKFVEQNINRGAVDARQAFGRQLSAIGDTSSIGSQTSPASSPGPSNTVTAAILAPDFSKLTQVQHHPRQQKPQNLQEPTGAVYVNRGYQGQKSSPSRTYDAKQYRRPQEVRQYHVKGKRSSGSSSEEAAWNRISDRAVSIERKDWSSIIMDRVHGA